MLAADHLAEPGHVLPQLLHVGARGDRAVSGEVRVGVERQDRVERTEPPLERPEPHHRGRADEQHVGAEDDPGVGHVDDRVARRVGRADLDQPDLAAADVEREFAAERPLGETELDLREAKRREHPRDVRRERAHRSGHPRAEGGGAGEAGELGRGGVGVDRLPARGRREDLGVGGRGPVAPPVVAVGVGVEHLADRPSGPDAVHRGEHLPSESLVPQGVDEQARVLARDQSGVRLAPPAVRLEPPPHAVAELGEPLWKTGGITREGVGGWHLAVSLRRREDRVQPAIISSMPERVGSGELRTRPRFPAVPGGTPHYESFYLKAADPEGGRAVWLRHTIWQSARAPRSAALWLTVFDATGAPAALKASFPAERLRSGPGIYVGIADAVLAPGSAAGSFVHDGRRASWDLVFDDGPALFGYLPRAWMYERALPRTKAVLVHPRTEIRGSVELDGRRLDLDGWPGMVGHNWGSEHPHRGVWIQASGFDEAPGAVLDLIAGRIRIGPLSTPWIANGLLVMGGERIRLGGLRPGAGEITATPAGARFRLKGTEVTVRGEVHAPRDRFVGWRYANPAGGWHPTLHCSIADLSLSVLRGDGPGRSLTATGRAAYELQLPEDDHGVELQPFPDP